MQRLRQLEASWLRSGQTTSLFASVIEKDDVRDDLGGILDVSVIANPHQANKEAVEGEGLQGRAGIAANSRWCGGRRACS